MDLGNRVYDRFLQTSVRTAQWVVDRASVSRATTETREATITKTRAPGVLRGCTPAGQNGARFSEQGAYRDDDRPAKISTRKRFAGGGELLVKANAWKRNVKTHRDSNLTPTLGKYRGPSGLPQNLAETHNRSELVAARWPLAPGETLKFR